MRRAARNLATSSKKSLCTSQKKESRGAKSSTSSPRAIPRSTYSKPLRSVYASSCTPVGHAQEKGDPRREVVHVDPARAPPLHVLEAVAQRVRQLLHRGGPRLADVVAGDGDGVVLGRPPGAPLEEVDDQPERRLRRVHPG